LIEQIAPVLSAVFRELTLSPRILNNILLFLQYPNSKSRLLKEKTFCTAVTSPIYSASVDKSIIIGCLDKYYKIGPPAARYTKLISEKAYKPSSG
jgi:hypothetical protein